MTVIFRTALWFFGWALIGCLLTESVFAQGSGLAEISGKVVDHEGGRPIRGALVRVERSGYTVGGVTTDQDGAFVISRLEPGAGRLVVSLIGYDTQDREISLKPGVGIAVDVALSSNPIELAPVEIIADSPIVRRSRPGAVSTIRPEVVQLIKPVGTQELLELIPGITGYADDGFGNSRLSIGIRGLNPRRSSRVLILEDGVPIQPAVYVYPNVYYNPPAERIDGVEVIKSSSAVRYGPQTMGGVINYTTRRPNGVKGAFGQFTAGSNGFYSVSLEKRGLGSERFITDVQALYKRGDGYRDNNAFEQFNGTVKSQYLLGNDKLIYLKANANIENSKATYTGLTEYSFRTAPNFNPKEDDNFKVLRFSLDLMYSNRISENVNSNTTLYFNAFDRRWWREDDVFVRASALRTGELTPVPYFENGDLVRTGGGVSNFGILRTFYVGGLAQDYEIAHTLAGSLAEAQFGARVHVESFRDDKKVGHAPDARIGIFYTGTPDDENDPVQIVGQSHYYETAALALYAKERMRWGSLTIDSGGRVELFRQDRVDRLRGSILSDRVSAVFLPGLGVNYRIGHYNAFAGIYRGYTPPSSGTLKVTNFGESVATGGLDLKPEKSWNMEIGFRSFRPGISMEATGFLVKVSDLVAAGRGTAFKNLGKVETRGLELGLEIGTSLIHAAIPDLNVSYTYLQTEIKSGMVKSATRAGAVVDLAGNSLPYAPPHTVVIGISKEMEMGLSLRAAFRLVDRVYTDFENIERTSNRGDTGPVSSYSTVSVSANYRISAFWSAFVTGKNLLDEVYIGSRLHSNPGQPEANLSSGILIGPRRQINIGLKRVL